MKQFCLTFIIVAALLGCILFSRIGHSQCLTVGYYSFVGAATSTAPYICVTLTPDVLNQLGYGCAWYTTSTLDFTTSFNYNFIVNLGTKDATGADGITFVAQNDPRGLCACGSSGGSTLGASGITNSLIIEIDTYLSDEDRDDGMLSVLCSGGPEPDHLDIWTNGNVNPSGTGCPSPAGARTISNAIELMDGASPYNIENGSDHILRISWDAATTTITAFLMDVALTTTYGTVSYSFNPLSIFGTNTPYFGFTGGTGGLSNQQSFCTSSTTLLPIELMDFKAVCHNNTAKLRWATASETNNQYFTIERSADNTHFETIGKVGGAGNSTTVLFYTWEDDAPLGDDSYYRIRQTDFDGITKVYAPISFSSCSVSNIEVNISPNPFSEAFHVMFRLKNNSIVSIKLSDTFGRKIKTIAENEIQEKGVCNYTVSLTEPARGVYFLSIQIDDFLLVKKVIRN